MKITPTRTIVVGYLRCPEDGKIILSIDDGDVTLQDCEHYHWHLTMNNRGTPDLEKGVSVKDFDILDDWHEFLVNEHVGIIAVDDVWYYLMNYTERVYEPKQ